MVQVGFIVAALIVAPVSRWIDEQTNWTLMGFAADGARNVLGALASSLLTFIVFALSILLLSVQMASGQLTPRIIARFFEQRLTKLTVGAFVFAWVYSLSALGRVEDRVPQLPVLIAILLSLVGVVLFLYLVQSAVQGMRPITILTDIADETRAVIGAVYPERFSSDGGEHSRLDQDRRLGSRAIQYRGHSSVVLALDIDRLLAIATRADCAIEIVPEVGDFLATGDDFFRLHGASVDAVQDGELLDCLELGPERTLEQDPAYGFRIIVDIASRALSPAVNDPSTAVLAIDQLHHLLHVLGQRLLDNGVVRDASGAVRVVYRTPDWEDFVTLAATEVRIYGATSPQVTRRLQAMFEHLLRHLPEERGDVLSEQMSLLRRAVERSFSDPEDRVMALSGDRQGFGSAAPHRDERAA